MLNLMITFSLTMEKTKQNLLIKAKQTVMIRQWNITPVFFLLRRVFPWNQASKLKLQQNLTFFKTLFWMLWLWLTFLKLVGEDAASKSIHRLLRNINLTSKTSLTPVYCHHQYLAILKMRPFLPTCLHINLMSKM